VLGDVWRPIGTAVDQSGVLEGLLLTLVTEPAEPAVDFTHLQSSESGGHGIAFYIDGVRCAPSRLRRPCFLPLDAIVPPLFDYDGLSSLFATVSPTPELMTLLSWVTSDSLASQLTLLPAPVSRRTISRNVALHSQLTALLSQGTLQREENPRHCQSFFLVPKSNLASSRLIQDCRQLNELIHKAVEVPKMPLPDIRDAINRILRFPVVWSVDAKSMFYQFAVSSSLSQWLGGRIGGARGEFTSVVLRALPMGVTFAPTFAQHVANYICECVQRRYSGSRRVDVFAWVDNFVFLAETEEDSDLLRQAFYDIAAIVNLRVKEEIRGPEIELLGLRFDLTKSVVRPSDRSKGKLQETLAEISNGSHEAFMRWLGTALWVNHTTLRRPLCFAEHLMRRLRSIATTADWYGASEITPMTLAQAAEFTTAARESSTSARPPAERGTETLVSDASTQGMAGLLGDRAFNWMAPIPQRRIFCAELLAGLCAAEFCKVPERYGWTTDNAAAARAMERGHSSSPLGDEILRKWISRGPPSMITLVPTECMIADGLSRGRYEVAVRCAHIHPTTTVG